MFCCLYSFPLANCRKISQDRLLLVHVLDEKTEFWKSCGSGYGMWWLAENWSLHLSQPVQIFFFGLVFVLWFFFFLTLTFIFLLPPCTVSLDSYFIQPICFLNSPSETLLLHYFCVSYLHLASGTPSLVFGSQSELDRKSDIKQVKKK